MQSDENGVQSRICGGVVCSRRRGWRERVGRWVEAAERGTSTQSRDSRIHGRDVERRGEQEERIEGKRGCPPPRQTDYGTAQIPGWRLVTVDMGRQGGELHRANQLLSAAM
jgi:hypothetical protein